MHGAGALDQIGPGHQRTEEDDRLAGVHRAIRVEHHDHVARRRVEPGGPGGSPAAPGLGHNEGLGIEFQGDLDSIVGRAAIDDDDFMRPLWDSTQYMWKVLGLSGLRRT